MKRRTRITAWAFMIIPLLGLLNFQIEPDDARSATGIFVFICFLVIAAMWICILMRRPWARPVLLTALAIYVGHGGVSAAKRGDGVADWIGFVLVMGVFVGWQAFVLLKENPREWGKEITHD